jgi:hypothetical protein
MQHRPVAELVERGVEANRTGRELIWRVHDYEWPTRGQTTATGKRVTLTSISSRPQVPRQGRLRPVHLHRSGAGVVRCHRREGASQPRRQPAGQLGAAHDRGDQARGVGPGKAYLAKQRSRGKDRPAAFRLLRRQLSDAVFTALRADQIVKPIPLPRLLVAVAELMVRHW